MTKMTVDGSTAADGAQSGRTGTVIAGVVATAAGATAVPQLLGLFANVAQVAGLARSELLFVGNIVIVALGLIALFAPGQAGYRRSAARVCVTACAVLVSGTLAGLGVSDRMSGEPPPITDVALPSASLSASFSSTAKPPPSAGRSTGNAVPAGPIAAPGEVRTTTPPARDPTARPTSTRVAVKATMTCTPASCVTSEDIIALSGTLSGGLASGHQLILFVQAPDGRHYPGSKGQVLDGRWSGKVHVGSKNGSETGYAYTACLYDIDATFAADLDSRSEDELNQGLTRVPTSGTAASLACRQLRWNRP